MDVFIEKYIHHCKVCQYKKGNRPTAPPPLSLNQQFTMDDLKPFEIISIDLIDLNQHPSRGYRYIVNTIDFLTGYIEAAPLKAPTGNAIAKFIEERYILRGHVPKYMLSDRGINLIGGKLKECCAEWGIKMLHTARYNPRCNGKVERANGSFKRTMKTIVSDEGKDWSDLVKVVSRTMNISKSSTTGYTPYFLVHGQHPRTPWSNKIMYQATDPNPNPSPLTMEEHWKIARESAKKAAEKWAGKPSKIRIPVFKLQDKVLIYKFRHEQGKAHSLVDLWEGPFVVVHCGDHHNYIVVNERDKDDERSVNVSQMKKYYEDPKQIVIPFEEIEKDRKVADELEKPTIVSIEPRQTRSRTKMTEKREKEKFTDSRESHNSVDDTGSCDAVCGTELFSIVFQDTATSSAKFKEKDE